MKNSDVLYVHSNQGCHVLLEEVGHTFFYITGDMGPSQSI